MFKLAELFVQITGRDADFQAKLAGIKSQLEGFAAKFSRFAVPLAAAGVGLAGIAAAITSAVGAAGDFNETLSKTETLLGKNAARAVKFADDMYARFGASKREMLDAVSALYLMGKAAGKSDGDAMQFSETLTKLADDASSMLNVSFDTAMEKIRAGLRGESEPLSAWNVFLNEAAVKAKAAEMGMRGVNGELSAGEKIAARAAVIMEQLGYVQGDHANTQGSYNNQLKEFNGRLEQLKTTLGQGVLPLFNATLKAVNPMVDGLGRMADAAGRLRDALTPPSSSILGQVSGSGVLSGAMSTAFAGAAFGPLGGLASALGRGGAQAPGGAGGAATTAATAQAAAVAAVDPRVKAAREVLLKEAEKEAADRELQAERVRQAIERYHRLEKERDLAFAKANMPHLVVPTRGGGSFLSDAFAGINARSERAAIASLVQVKSLAQAFAAMRLQGPAGAASGLAALGREGLERLEWRMNHRTRGGVTDVDSLQREVQDAALNAARDSLQEQRNQTALLSGIKAGIEALGQIRTMTALFGKR